MKILIYCSTRMQIQYWNHNDIFDYRSKSNNNNKERSLDRCHLQPQTCHWGLPRNLGLAKSRHLISILWLNNLIRLSDDGEIADKWKGTKEMTRLANSLVSFHCVYFIAYTGGVRKKSIKLIRTDRFDFGFIRLKQKKPNRI